MSQRSSGSGVISFGLVSIPFKLYTSATAEAVNFNMLNPKTNNRVKQLLIDGGTNDTISRSDTVKGYEVSKGQYVVFTPEEIKSLQGEKSNCVDIQEFVPEETIDLYRGTEKVFLLGPDKGGDKAYQVLLKALRETERVAVAKWFPRSKEHLVVIRVHGDDLVMHQMFYKNELKNFENPCANVEIRDIELDMACKLIDQLSNDAFDISKYSDDFVKRVSEAVDAKNAGENIVYVDSDNGQKLFDLFDTLKASLANDTKTATKKTVAKKKVTKKRVTKKTARKAS